MIFMNRNCNLDKLKSYLMLLRKRVNIHRAGPRELCTLSKEN